jgi:CBS domain-containing protein
MRVADIMTARVVSCAPETPLSVAARLMCEHDCGAIPVLDEHRRPIGIVTDRDIACRAVAEGYDTRTTAVRDVMSRPVETVFPETTIDACCALLEKNQIRRVVVVDDVGACWGIVAQADIARHVPLNETGDVVRAVSKSTTRREVGAIL